VLGFFAISVAGPVHAQTPQFLVSWRAGSYVPTGYAGKTLVGYQDPITFSVELTSQGSSGANRVVDISGREVRWYVNDTLYAKGVGMQSFTLDKEPLFAGGNLSIRVSVDFYDPDTYTSRFVDKYINVPVVSPEAVVSANSFGSVFSPGSSPEISVTPFFFSAPNTLLRVQWFLSGQPVDVAEDPFHVLLHINASTTASGVLSVSINNPQSSLPENASANYTFSVR